MAINRNGTEVITDSLFLTNVSLTNSTYDNFLPTTNVISTSGGSASIFITDPVAYCIMTENTSFTISGVSTRLWCSTLLLDTSVSNWTPTFTGLSWPNDTAPQWSDYRYWVVSFVSWGTISVISANAAGYGL